MDNLTVKPQCTVFEADGKEKTVNMEKQQL
jgi:hypothetical protein